MVAMINIFKIIYDMKQVYLFEYDNKLSKRIILSICVIQFIMISISSALLLLKYSISYIQIFIIIGISFCLVNIRNIIFIALSAGILLLIFKTITTQGKKQKYDEWLIVFMLSHVILILMRILSMTIGIVSWIVGWENTFVEYPIAGINLFISISSVPEYIQPIFKNTNIFTCWYLCLSTIGISKRGRISIIIAMVISVSVWILSILLMDTIRKAASLL